MDSLLTRRRPLAKHSLPPQAIDHEVFCASNALCKPHETCLLGGSCLPREDEESSDRAISLDRACFATTICCLQSLAPNERNKPQKPTLLSHTSFFGAYVTKDKYTVESYIIFWSVHDKTGQGVLQDDRYQETYVVKPYTIVWSVRDKAGRGVSLHVARLDVLCLVTGPRVLFELCRLMKLDKVCLRPRALVSALVVYTLGPCRPLLRL